MAKYTPQPITSYPATWREAAAYAARQAQLGSHPWLEVAWARTESTAVLRMKRLRAFRDALLLFPHDGWEVLRAQQSGLELRFRKLRDPRGIWLVQLSWQPKLGTTELIAGVLDEAQNVAPEVLRTTY